MSDLKRKREDDESPQEPDVSIAASTPATDDTNDAQPPSANPHAASDTSSTSQVARSPHNRQTEISDDSRGGMAATGATAGASEEKAITICGKRVVLKGGGGGGGRKRKRKQPLEAMVLMAYKARLAQTCKANDMISALEMYREMKTKGIKQDLGVHQMVLAVCGGSPGEKDDLDPGNGATASSTANAAKGGGSGNGASAAPVPDTQSGSAQQNTAAAADAAIQILDGVTEDDHLSLPESAYTGVIRACCLDGRADKAREILELLKRTKERPRLRTYAPLIEAYAQLDGGLQDCMSVWRDAVSPAQDLTMTEREYLFLIKACTLARDEACFMEVMREYMEDVVQPRSVKSWDVLRAWFEAASSAAVATADPGQEEGSKALLTGAEKVLKNGSGDGAEVTPATENGADASPTPTVAHTPTTEAELKKVYGVEVAGGSACEGGGGGERCRGLWKLSECKVALDGSCLKCGEVLRSIELSEDEEQRLLTQVEVLVCTNEERTKQWEGYRGWLERRGRERYNVIIDGANVGYYKQNAADAGELADLKQVDWAVKKFEAEGKKPLVVLHSRHLADKRLSDESKEILRRWREDKTIQSCAPKNNDDWYWLYAAVYIGGRVLVLTNDEMRDHHFSMLSHRSFQRWKERHQIRFTFGEWKGNIREVVTDEPRAYSKRSQKSVDGKSWHFPLDGSDDWLCVTLSK